MFTNLLHLRFWLGVFERGAASTAILALVVYPFVSGCLGSSPSVPQSDADAIKKAVIEEYRNRDRAIEVVNVRTKDFDGKSAEVEATLKWPEFHSITQKRDVKLKKKGGKWVVVSVEEK